jgi:Ca2+:H+ antiporter
MSQLRTHAFLYDPSLPRPDGFHEDPEDARRRADQVERTRREDEPMKMNLISAALG